MFRKNIDDRLTMWLDHRKQLEEISNPFDSVWEFWKEAPFIPYNKNIDPFNRYSWPSPWEIIVENKYDDFTKALMIGWTLKLTKRFHDSSIEIKTLLDNTKSLQYNIVYVNDEWAINYSDNGPILARNVPESFLLENLIELEAPR